jgi:ArsR family transcriptional regulator
MARVHSETASNRHTAVMYRVDDTGHMQIDPSIEAFSALAQPTRLEAFRLLVRSEPDGLAAGVIARKLDVPHNTNSTHLGILLRTGLASVERRSRSLIYRARLETVRSLVLFLERDCCNDRPDVCVPIISDITSASPPHGCRGPKVRGT